jgi:hypothetical protein
MCSRTHVRTPTVGTLCREGSLNSYGQIESHVDHKGKSSAGEACDLLLEMFVERAYLDNDQTAEPPAVVDGVTVSPRANLNPQKQHNGEGIIIRNPAFYAEMKQQEQAIWKLLRKGYARFRDLEGGLCLRCRQPNDNQARRRYCSECEGKMS